jgi:hypothetical protein
MREFINAFEDSFAEDERETKIEALIKQGKTREEAEKEVDGYSEFDIVDRDAEGNETSRRTLRAYPPHEGQLIFMMAALGRGQSNEQRFAAIVNIMMSSLRDEDADYLEGRLLERDPKKRLNGKMVEAIFEGLAEEWFARPTQSPSGSAGSPQTTGPALMPPTT